MTDAGNNIHATAVVIGTRGLILVGPSGAGKTALALALMATGKERGLFAAMISDDQVFISNRNGSIIARRPPAIAGLAEIRGAAVVSVDSIETAVLDFAILPVRPPFHPRLPPENEQFELPGGNRLPLWRLPYGEGANSFDLLRRILPQDGAF